MLSNQAVVQKQALVIRHELRKEPWLLGTQCLFLLRTGDQSDPQSWEQLVPLPALWQLNGAGIGFLQRLCNAEARYVARVLCWGAREGGWEQPWCRHQPAGGSRRCCRRASSLCCHSRRPVSDRRSSYRITAIHFGQFFRCAQNVGVTREPSGEYPRGGIPLKNPLTAQASCFIQREGLKQALAGRTGRASVSGTRGQCPMRP